MTKVYLVKAIQSGRIGSHISKVFTNKRKAEHYVRFMNDLMDKYKYHIEEYPICQTDFKPLPF